MSAQAIAHIREAFQSGVKNNQQLEAILPVVRPAQLDFCLRVFDAAGLDDYPEDHLEKIKKATEILENVLKTGGASEKMIAYATGFTGHHTTPSHQWKINEAFS